MFRYSSRSPAFVYNKFYMWARLPCIYVFLYLNGCRVYSHFICRPGSRVYSFASKMAAVYKAIYRPGSRVYSFASKMAALYLAVFIYRPGRRVYRHCCIANGCHVYNHFICRSGSHIYNIFCIENGCHVYSHFIFRPGNRVYSNFCI